MTFVFIAGIRLYQKFFSPDHGNFFAYAPHRRCRFFPSCSEYTIQALGQYGLLVGIVVSFKRVLRCHPFSAGGYDPVSARVRCAIKQNQQKSRGNQIL
ncbi:membrane protein insertion efficiency factor YidD [Patescibacteria group bacterium]|nr:membrane protein insertion efficiency factor YidD [Patescibacteria group bacterium]